MVILSDEKNWPVQAHNVVIPLSSIQLDSKSPRVASKIRKLLPQRDCTETKEQRRLLAHRRKEVGFGKLGDILGDLKVAEMAGTGGVDTTFDDLFADKGLLLFEEVGVAGYRETTDVEGVGAIGGPRGTDWKMLVGWLLDK